MRFSRYIPAILVAGVASASSLCAADCLPLADMIRAAVDKSIPLLEKGTRGAADQRQCFTCHNQAVPVLALAEVRKRGFVVDEENFQRQLRHTYSHLERGKQNYLDGSGQGGRVVTAGYALWTLAAGGRLPDDTTSAVTSFLLEYQKDGPHWNQRGRRPPSTGSDFTATYVALRGLAAFGTDQQQPGIEARSKEIQTWLLSARPRDTEDHVFRLRSMPYVDAGDDAVHEAISAMIDLQQVDGGWAQTAVMTSDAYATATVLVTLLRSGAVAADHPAVGRGLCFLLSTQREDGSWHVVTRAKPFQKYFETGFPHGKDQFISMAASGWSTLALALALPESP